MQFLYPDCGGKPFDAEIGRMHLQDGAGVISQSALVIGQVRAVSRPYFFEARGRGLDELGQAKASSDLNELAARNDDLFAGSERGGGQKQGAGAVIDYEGILCTGAGCEQRGRGSGAAISGSLARAQVHFHICIGGSGLQGLYRGAGKRGTP